MADLPEAEDVPEEAVPDAAVAEPDVEKRVTDFLAETERSARESLGFAIGSSAADVVVGPTAPVVIPPDSRMKVRLITIADLHRLDETRSDSGLMLSFVLLFGGAALGFVTTMLVAEAVEFTRWTNTFLGLLVLVTLIFLALFIRSSVRGARLRREVFSAEED